MNKLVRFSKMLFLLLLVIFVAGCGHDGGNGNSTESTSLVAIEVTQENPSIAKGTTNQFTATGIYSDNTTKDLTSSVTWSSSDSTMATITPAGLATGEVAGSPTIKAQSGDIFGTSKLTITDTVPVSLTVTPTNPNFAMGTTVKFTATAIFTDNSTQDLSSQVTWNSSNESVITISNIAGSKGVATSVAAGSATITATLGLVKGTNSPTVTAETLKSIAVTTTNASISKGKTSQCTATGIFSDDSNQDLTSQVTWSSSVGSVATVSNAAGSKGLATAVSAGTTVITATVGSVSGTNNLTVTSATLTSIAVTPIDPSITKGKTSQFTATGTFSDNSKQNITASVTWSSSIGSVATISNAAASKGLATSVAAGTTTMKAIDPATLKAGSTTLKVTAATLTSIAVTPLNQSLAKGRTSQFTATGTFSDNTKQNITSSVTWSSSTGSVATISNVAASKGLATLVAAGVTTIKAIDSATLKQDSTTLNVTGATLASIALKPTNPVISPAGSEQFSAMGTFSDDSTQDITSSLTWSSSNESVATISNAAGSVGLATAGVKGSTTITAIDPVTKKSRNTILTVALQPVDLGTAGNFVILAKTGVSTTGTTAVVGNIGVSPIDATAITGFGLIADSTNVFSTSSLVTGKLYAANYAVPTPANLTTAVGDMQTAFTDAAGRTTPDFTELGAGDISGLTLAPGLYKWGTGVLISSAGVTLAGGADDVWIFQIAEDLTVNSSAAITLSPGVQPKNIFWQVSGQTTVGTAAVFNGIILSQTLISFNTGAVMNGRALAQTAVTLNANRITAP